MKKNKWSAAVGILLVLAIGCAFIGFCKISEENVPLNERMLYDDDDDWDDDDEDDSAYNVQTLGQRDYDIYQSMPDRIRKLIDLDIFGVTDEKVEQYKKEYLYEEWDDYDDEDEDGGYYDDYYDDMTPEEIAAEMEEELEELEEELKEDCKYSRRELEAMGSPEFLAKEKDLIVTTYEQEEEELYCLLKWDDESKRFADSEKIKAIEDCGFPGFTELMSEVERRIQEEPQSGSDAYSYYDYDDDDDYGEQQYRVYCGGVVFDLYREWDYTEGEEEDIYGQYFTVTIELNNSMYYIPEKYRSVIDSVTGDGGYFLSSSCVGGKKEALVFSRNNSISEYRYDATKTNKYDNKRIVFLFEDGKLVDYYVVALTSRLDLDDVDKRILDAYAPETGKTLSATPEGDGYEMYGYLYRAE